MQERDWFDTNTRRLPGVLCLILAATTWMWPIVIVVGDHVVSPLHLFIVLSGASLLLLWGACNWGGRALVVVVVVMSGIVVWFNDGIQAGTVLPEKGPDGCRIVVVERSFLFAGGGDIGTISTPLGIVNTQSRYESDDGARPFTWARSHYTLAWEGRTAHVHAPGDRNDGAWPADHTLRC